MKRIFPLALILLALILLSASVLISCSNGKNPTSSANGPTGKAQVTAQEVELDDTALLLDIKKWKFNVTIPPSYSSLSYTLEVRDKEKKPHVLAGLVFGPTAPTTEITVALHPTDDSWPESEKVKTDFRAKNIGGGSNLVNNPFKGCSVGSAGKAVLLSDGSYLLIVGNRGDRSAVWPALSENDVALVLKLGFGNKQR